MNSYNEQESCSIYLRYVPILRIMAGSMRVPVDDRDDLVQETFAKYIANYSEKSKEWSETQIKSVLITIFKNSYVDYLRRMSVRPVAYMDPVQIESGEVSSESLVGKDPQTVILEKQEYQDIMDVLNKMKPEWSEIIKLLVIEERSVEEVSEQLGISKEACRTRLCRAREKLRSMLGRGEPEKKSEPKKWKQKDTAESDDEMSIRIPEYSGIPEPYIGTIH